MALTETPVCNFNEAAVDFNLPGVDGRHWTFADCAGANGTLLMFICNHCPYVKAIRLRLVEDVLKLIDIGINSVAVMSNDPTDYPEDSFANMQRIAGEFAYPFPYLLDETQETARAYGAVCTPDFFGYNNDRKLQYRGRLDAGGINPVTDDIKRDLLEAMTEVADTGRGPKQQIPSVGCSIKWKKGVS